LIKLTSFASIKLTSFASIKLTSSTGTPGTPVRGVLG
jgi:hypothetical protein